MANPHPVKAWKKGQSGNPSGRPAAHIRFGEMVREATNNGVDLLTFALGVWKGTEKDMDGPADRRWAHDWLTERGFGRPQPEIEIAGEAAKKPLDYSAMSIEELQVMAKFKAANAVPVEPDPESPPTLRIVTDDELGGAA